MQSNNNDNKLTTSVLATTIRRSTRVSTRNKMQPTSIAIAEDAIDETNNSDNNNNNNNNNSNNTEILKQGNPNPSETTNSNTIAPKPTTTTPPPPPPTAKKVVGRFNMRLTITTTTTTTTTEEVVVEEEEEEAGKEENSVDNDDDDDNNNNNTTTTTTTRRRRRRRISKKKTTTNKKKTTSTISKITRYIVSDVPFNSATQPRAKSDPKKADVLQDVSAEGAGWWFILRTSPSLVVPLAVTLEHETRRNGEIVPEAAADTTNGDAAESRSNSGSIPPFPREGDLEFALTYTPCKEEGGEEDRDEIVIYRLESEHFAFQSDVSTGVFHVDKRRAEDRIAKATTKKKKESITVTDRLLLRIEKHMLVAVRLFLPLSALPQDWVASAAAAAAETKNKTKIRKLEEVKSPSPVKPTTALKKKTRTAMATPVPIMKMRGGLINFMGVDDDDDNNNNKYDDDDDDEHNKENHAINSKMGDLSLAETKKKKKKQTTQRKAKRGAGGGGVKFADNSQLEKVHFINNEFPVDWHIEDKPVDWDKIDSLQVARKDFNKAAQAFSIFEIPCQLDTKQLTIKELKAELKAVGLKTTGTKQQLVERLEQYIIKNQPPKQQKQQQQQYQPEEYPDLIVE